MYMQSYIVTRSRNLCCRGNETLPSLFVVFGIDVAVNNIKVFSLPWKWNSGFPLLCCRATKYFVLLLTVISII